MNIPVLIVEKPAVSFFIISIITLIAAFVTLYLYIIGDHTLLAPIIICFSLSFIWIIASIFCCLYKGNGNCCYTQQKNYLPI